MTSFEQLLKQLFAVSREIQDIDLADSSNFPVWACELGTFTSTFAKLSGSTTSFLEAFTKFNALNSDNYTSEIVTDSGVNDKFFRGEDVESLPSNNSSWATKSPLRGPVVVLDLSKKNSPKYPLGELYLAALRIFNANKDNVKRAYPVKLLLAFYRVVSYIDDQNDDLAENVIILEDHDIPTTNAGNAPMKIVEDLTKQFLPSGMSSDQLINTFGQVGGEIKKMYQQVTEEGSKANSIDGIVNLLKSPTVQDGLDRIKDLSKGFLSPPSV